jgi:hypothetical protein
MRCGYRRLRPGELQPLPLMFATGLSVRRTIVTQAWSSIPEAAVSGLWWISLGHERNRELPFGSYATYPQVASVSADLNLDRQLACSRRSDCRRVFREKLSGRGAPGKTGRR